MIRLECVGPRDVPDLRLWLIDEWRPGSPFWKVADVAWAVRDRELFAKHGPATRHPALWEGETLKLASLYWVGADMVSLLEAAIPGVPGDLLGSDCPFPSGAGLVVFERPLSCLDGQTGARVDVDAFVFGGCHLSEQQLDAIAVSSYRRNGRINDDEYARRFPFAPLGRSDWPVSYRLDRSVSWFTSDAMTASAEEDRRIVAAFSLLLTQEGIASRTVDIAPREVRRRSQRAHGGVSSDVTVVALRRARHDSDSPGAEPVSHDHRWMVTGHWRWQPVGEGRRERRLTWVRPHIKGPDGAPLKTPTKVYSWTK